MWNLNLTKLIAGELLLLIDYTFYNDLDFHIIYVEFLFYL